MTWNTFKTISVELRWNMLISLHLLSTVKVNLGTGESSLHYYVDFFMRNFLEVILFSLSLRIDIDRNTADLSKTTLEKLRPDFLFYVKDFLILRGEEKSSISAMGDAKNELISKLKSWNSAIFGKLNYVFGFVCAGGLFQLYAIGPSGLVLELSNELDLRLRGHRFQLVFILIQLARVINTMINQIPSNRIVLYRPMSSGDRGTIEITDDYVVKKLRIPGELLDVREKFLWELYVSLKKHAVPFVPKCTYFRQCSTIVNDIGVIEVRFTPLGLHILPQSFEELLVALKCILQALDSVHKLGYAHGDIRWPNILHISDNNWILIDFEEACYGNISLYQEDIRKVGRLIDEWVNRYPTLIPLMASAFRDALVLHPPSASDALGLLEDLDLFRNQGV